MKHYVVALAMLGFVLSVHAQEVQPWTEQENEIIKQWWRDGILTDDNFPRFLEALKKEAHHPDRLERALEKSNQRSFFRLSGSNLGEYPLQTLCVILLTIVFILFIVIQKKEMITIAAVCWFIGIIVNLPTLIEYLVGSVIVVPLAIFLRWLIHRAKPAKEE